MKHLVSQLAHAELLTPDVDRSTAFFRGVLGMEESARDGTSVYLRGWGEFPHHSVKLTEGTEPGLGHGGWRADSAQALDAAVAELEGAGLGRGWTEGDVGHGPAFRFETPDGHPMELFWETERAAIPADLRTGLRGRPQKYTGRGAAVRRLDHLNLMASDVGATRRAFTDTLGFRCNELLVADGEQEISAWLSVTNLAHDVAVGADFSGARGRLHHLALWQDSREDVMRTADILRDADVAIEWGPSHHGITDSFFLYCIEPGGNRIEIYSGGYLVFEPDREPIVWHMSDQPFAGSWWEGTIPESAGTYGTPPLGVPAPGTPGVAVGTA